MKKLIVLLITVLVVCFTSINVCAHNTSDCGYAHSASLTGWDIYETSWHWPSYNTVMTVDCGDFVGSSFESYIVNAVNTWNSTAFNGAGLVSMEIDNNSGCVVFKSGSKLEIREIAGSGAWACVFRSNASCDSNNHYLTTPGNIEIWVDWNETVSTKSSRAKTHVPLHEIGHVIGLKDIPGTVSYNSYLMCNEFGNYAVPIDITLNDKQGAAVILGQHTIHAITYVSYDSTRHRGVCTLCGAWTKALSLHNISGGSCTVCGYSTILRMVDPEWIQSMQYEVGY